MDWAGHPNLGQDHNPVTCSNCLVGPGGAAEGSIGGLPSAAAPDTVEGMEGPDTALREGEEGTRIQDPETAHSAANKDQQSEADAAQRLEERTEKSYQKFMRSDEKIERKGPSRGVWGDLKYWEKKGKAGAKATTEDRKAEEEYLSSRPDYVAPSTYKAQRAVTQQTAEQNGAQGSPVETGARPNLG